MSQHLSWAPRKGLLLSATFLCGVLLAAVLLAWLGNTYPTRADPIDPPDGSPKLSLSVKTVTPTLAHVGGATLYYAVEIRNTGSYTAYDATLVETIPGGTTYNDDAQASEGAVTPGGGHLTWTGEVGFDATVVISFSVTASPLLSGTVLNTAVISHPLIAEPVTVTAEAMITDDPLLVVTKTSEPTKPGPGRPLTYTLVVTNRGQPAADLPITVTDRIPADTSLGTLGTDGASDGTVVTWTRRVTMDVGETAVFSFSVDVGSVPSGTVITNDDYRVAGPGSAVSAGETYTTTIVDPILMLSKYVWPDPPGSNREMTYTLQLVNIGSMATGLVITDRIPTGVQYRSGGSKTGNQVRWTLPSLDTGEVAQFTYTVYISDVMDVPILNKNYAVCCQEGVCQPGPVLTSIVGGPTFEAFAILDPIAKGAGGGTKPVTPTLVVRNLGPGNAIAATALIQFVRISVSNLGAVEAVPPIGTFSDGPDCGDNCYAYFWTGDLAYGEAVTLTTTIDKGTRGRSTIGGEEGTIYTATVVITDSLANMVTEPITGTATGRITHYANLIPTKSGPSIIGLGQLLTYTIDIWNSGYSTDVPPSPVLTEVVPLSTTFVSASDGGAARTLSGTTVISWALPALSTGAHITRSFTVRVPRDLISGTQLINDQYGTSWHETEVITGFAKAGLPVTTTVQEVGLIDSYKEVTPVTVLPGPDNVLTYYLHIVNSSPVPLSDVSAYDQLPWAASTYQRDAVASAGQVVSDIVSIRWSGDVGPFSSEIVTFTVRVDPDYEGVITNTAVISHADLVNPVEVHAVTYVTTKPVLEITKSAAPDPVLAGDVLVYTIQVTNWGQQATTLVITDTIPADTEYVPQSATTGGQLVGNEVRWSLPVLTPGESRTVAFQVTVQRGEQIVNDQYAVSCAEGVVAVGLPVVTQVQKQGGDIYLPLVLRNAP